MDAANRRADALNNMRFLTSHNVNAALDRNFMHFIIRTKDTAWRLFHRLALNHIEGQSIYDDYVEYTRWPYIIKCIRERIKYDFLADLLEYSIAIYDDSKVLVIAENDKAKSAVYAHIHLILQSLKQYGNSNINVLSAIHIPRPALYCNKCGNGYFSPQTNYCIICGLAWSVEEFARQHPWKGGVKIMNYLGPKTNLDNRLSVCPVCENEEFSTEARYCRICGLNRINICEGIWDDNYYGYGNGGHIHHENPPNARFCETCGTRTLFYNSGIIEPWKIVLGMEMDEIDILPEPIKRTEKEAVVIATPITADDDDNDLPF